MSYDTDAEDAQLLAAGDIGALLAKYDPTIRGRCVARLRGGPDADDVAQNVRLRLLDEFHRGRRYGSLPYRVVVNQVITWTVGDYFAGRRTDAPLPETWEPAEDDFSPAVYSREWLAGVFAALPERQREVLELRYLHGLEHVEIAERLGIERNAVDQALFNGHTKLREAFVHG